jgi:hypothetical protein
VFNGEESVRVSSHLPPEEMEDLIADALDRVGSVRVSRSGRFRIDGRRFDSSFATVSIEGELIEGRKDGEWRLVVSYRVDPSALCWVIVVLGALFCLAGVLILLAPNDTKNRVERAVRRAIRDARDDVENADEKDEARGGAKSD